MDSKTQRKIKGIFSRYTDTYMPMMKLNNAVIGAMCQLGEGYYEDSLKAMQAAGLSNKKISQVMELRKHQQVELVMHLGRDTMRKMTSIVEGMEPVFDSVGSDLLMHVYHKLAERLNTASATLQSSGTGGELTQIYELLAEVNHEIGGRMKMIRGNRNKNLSSLFAREVKSAPFAREVKAAVGLSDDLSFLNEKSWAKRINALRQRERESFAALSNEWQKLDPNRGELRAGERYIVNILKDIPKVREYLKLKTKMELRPM